MIKENLISKELTSSEFTQLVGQIETAGHGLLRSLKIFDNSRTFRLLRQDEPLPVTLTAEFLAGLRPLVVYAKATGDAELIGKIKTVLDWCKHRPFSEGNFRGHPQKTFLAMNPRMEERLVDLLEMLE